MKYILTILLSAGLYLSSCGKKEDHSAAANAKADSMKAGAKAVMDTWMGGDINELDKYIAADFKENTPSPMQKPGLEGLKEMITEMRKGYSNISTKIYNIFIDGDYCIVHSAWSGTNSGPMMGMPPTNKTNTDIGGVDIMRWQNGKFVEHWGYWEEMKMMTQLGLMPEMGAPPAPEAKKN